MSDIVEPVLETSTRLLNLLGLLQTRPHWSGAELAERLEVQPRTLRRDIDRLRRLGYPVDATPGVAGGYRLGAGASLPPLLLDDEEAVAIAVGLRTAVSGGVAGIGETSVRALSKLEALLPVRVRRRVHAVGAA
ncbi:MAG TPA: HTH domain-containing protein, partial [Solirubrobacteraceae bacterium]|nr:HTH domain-containing protein [Solirubrobacteraceae bacterium]